MEDGIEEEPKQAGVRRTFTRSNAARQVAVNFMPSRQLPYNTLRIRRNNSEHNALLEEVVDAPDAADRQVDIIVREMEQHQRLMEDDLEAEELRREALRDLPQGLTMKRHVRAKLSASVSLRSKRRPISLIKRLKYRFSFAWKRARDRIRNLFFSVELWYEAIRNIEGHFGSAVGSYFYFLRWLFTMDLVLSVFVVSFVVVPQVLHDEQRNGTVERGFMDFVGGKGSFEDSLLFYGHYHEGDISSPGYLTYNMPFAYFFTMACLYVMFFAVLCYKTAYSYRRNFIETAGGLSHVFANKVFCGWDFGIASSHAAALNASSIYYELKELLNEQNKKQDSLSVWTKMGQWLANAALTCFVLSVIGGLEWGFWELLGSETEISHWEILLTFTMTLALALMPLLFNLIVKLEYYSARTALYVTLARTWLLDASTLVLLLVYWSHSGQHCWETSFGQETYRLVLLDALISLFLLPIIEFIRGLIYKLYQTSRAPQFNIAYNSLTLIYNQALAWVGLLFSPLLVVAVTIKFLLLFYVKRECALRACQPARKVWRAAQTQTVFYMLVTLSLFTALLAIGSLFIGVSSKSCGPFRQYEYVYAVFTEGVLELSRRDTLRNVLTFLTKPGFIAFIILFLGVGVYYMRSKACAQRSMVDILRRMLVLQAKDKDFLLAAIANVSNGEWLYNPKLTEGEPDSYTWKYLNEVRRPSNADYHFDGSRLNHSLLEGRPKSYVKDNRPNSYLAERPKSHEDGDTDSSFSWQGSSNQLNQRDEEGREKKWI